jgi:hypothetical protein
MMYKIIDPINIVIRMAKMKLASSSSPKHILRLQLLASDGVLLLLDISLAILQQTALSSGLFLGHWKKLTLE